MRNHIQTSETVYSQVEPIISEEKISEANDDSAARMILTDQEPFDPVLEKSVSDKREPEIQIKRKVEKASKKKTEENSTTGKQ
jgi:hypothetical protein